MPIRQAGTPSPIAPELITAFARTVSPERWRTYRFAGGFNDDLAHRLYLWNAAIGQSFHFPLQAVEVALRNVVHAALTSLYGPSWSSDTACRAMLKNRQVDDIDKAGRRYFGIYGKAATTPHIVASLSLGFWVSLLRPNYNGPIWSGQLAPAFPHLGLNEGIADVSKTGTVIQELRNRIFHQEPLIGHNLSMEYASILKMLGWICPETKDWTRAFSSVPTVIRQRPR